MATTQLTLLFLAAFATLASLGLFYNFPDHWTGPLVGFVAAVTWGVVGVSAFEVTVHSGGSTFSYELTAFAYLAIGLALATALFALSDLIKGLGSEAEDTAQQGVMQP